MTGRHTGRNHAARSRTIGEAILGVAAVEAGGISRKARRTGWPKKKPARQRSGVPEERRGGHGTGSARAAGTPPAGRVPGLARAAAAAARLSVGAGPSPVFLRSRCQAMRETDHLQLRGDVDADRSGEFLLLFAEELCHGPREAPCAVAALRARLRRWLRSGLNDSLEARPCWAEPRSVLKPSSGRSGRPEAGLAWRRKWLTDRESSPARCSRKEKEPEDGTLGSGQRGSNGAVLQPTAKVKALVAMAAPPCRGDRDRIQRCS